MHPRFATLAESLSPSLDRLLACNPRTSGTLPKNVVPKSGIYLFSEGDTHLYVGRSNRLRSRIRRHGTLTSKHNVASFAFLIARRDTGRVNASYKTKNSRAELENDPVFSAAFTQAKQRISRMSVRWVEEQDQLRQALLEMYVHVALETQFNDFDTH